MSHKSKLYRACKARKDQMRTMSQEQLDYMLQTMKLPYKWEQEIRNIHAKQKSLAKHDIKD